MSESSACRVRDPTPTGPGGVVMPTDLMAKVRRTYGSKDVVGKETELEEFLRLGLDKGPDVFAAYCEIVHRECDEILADKKRDNRKKRLSNVVQIIGIVVNLAISLKPLVLTLWG